MTLTDLAGVRPKLGGNQRPVSCNAVWLVVSRVFRTFILESVAARSGRVRSASCRAVWSCSGAREASRQCGCLL